MQISQSLRRFTNRRRWAVEYHKRKIDQTRLDDIRRRFGDADPEPGFSKYLDCDRFLGTALSHCELAGLKDKVGLGILDIGTGAGYYPFVCRNLGHAAEGLDAPGHDFYTEMTSLLRVPRHEHRITPYQPLPDFGRKYDLITAFAICFNDHAKPTLWGPGEWTFLLNDLREHHLATGATIVLSFNQEPDGSYFSPEIARLFLSWHATLDEGKVAISV